MATCKDCLHYDVCKSYGVIMHNSLKLKMTDEVESKCPYKLFKSRTIKTHADRIRAMSDEELAEYIDSVAEACYNAGAEDLPLSNSNPLSNAYNILEWLKQPALDTPT